MVLAHAARRLAAPSHVIGAPADAGEADLYLSDLQVIARRKNVGAGDAERDRSSHEHQDDVTHGSASRIVASPTLSSA
jgi:hypothetical protein